MNWRKYVPRSAKQRYRKIRNSVMSLTFPPQKSREELHAYWKEPFDGENTPEVFLDPMYNRRTEYLAKIVQSSLSVDAGVMEVGCSAGRNLKALHSHGYSRLSGIDINEDAARMFRACFPDVATIHSGPVEEVIRTLSDRQFDLVFTVDVLSHIHRDSEWTFPEIARVADRYLFTYEDEGLISWRSFPRNYRKVFERIGWKQIREEVGENAIGSGGGFAARLFARN